MFSNLHTWAKLSLMINQYASLITIQTEQWQNSELKNVLTDSDLNTRRKLLESCVRSRLTYGTQAHPNATRDYLLQRSVDKVVKITWSWALIKQNVQPNQGRSSPS